MPPAKVKAPFVTDFGGFPIVERVGSGRLYCIEKNVQISIALLVAAVHSINKHPRGTKFLIGAQIIGSEKAHMWRDEFKTYIGCLDEPTVEFNKKYQKLIKHLKQ